MTDREAPGQDGGMGVTPPGLQSRPCSARWPSSGCCRDRRRHPQAPLPPRGADGSATLPPAIVHIYDIVDTERRRLDRDGAVEGKTLDRLLEGRPAAAGERSELMREIADGLAEAHAKGIVHRDLKASNVMVHRRRASEHSLDFGLVKRHLGGGGRARHWSARAIGGRHVLRDVAASRCRAWPSTHLAPTVSLPRVAPLRDGDRLLAVPRCDTAAETLTRIRDRPSRRPSSTSIPATPARAVELTHRLLSKAPAHRPHSSLDVVAALEQIEGRRSSGWRGGSSRREVSTAPMLDVRPDDVARPAPPAPPPAPLLSSSERRQLHGAVLRGRRRRQPVARVL